MDKALELSLRLAEDSMMRSKKLEERITELENLNNELENQANFKATDMAPNSDKYDDLLEQLTAKERTIMELQQQLTAQKEETLTEKKKVLDFQKEVKEMENEIRALKTRVAKGTETIKQHEEKIEEMVERLNDKNRNLNDELHNARTELDAKERKIKEVEENLRVEKQNHQVEINALKKKFKGMGEQERTPKAGSQAWTAMWTNKAVEVVCLEGEIERKDRKITELEHSLKAEKDKTQADISNERKRNRKENDQHDIFGSKIATQCENDDDIGVKKMGVIDSEPFHTEAKKIYGESKIFASESLSYWENFVNDPNWNPFKIVLKDGSYVEILDEADEELGRLKTLHNVEVCNAVKKALEEMKDHNRHGRYPVLELWNFSKNRKATLKEAEAYLDGRVSNKRRKIIQLD